MDYSIEQFWSSRFNGVQPQTLSKQLPGWDPSPAQTSSFVEANLSLRTDFNDLSQPIWLIAAPGAVGKSTLAREICASTHAVYLDLAAAATVAGNYLVGGLVNAGLWEAWGAGSSTLLIDALDEARLRVTQSSFEDFLTDVANVAGKRNVPVVLLGRVGIVEEAWAILNDKSKQNPPIFDIELFDADRAKTFVLSALNRLSGAIESPSEKKSYPHLSDALNSHRSIYINAVQYLMDQLGAATRPDGQQFAGYAPVLDAVATVIASESNPHKINDAVGSILQGQILGRVTSEVMIRESKKLAMQLATSHPGINADGLYQPAEQLSRLASRILGAGTSRIPETLPQHAVAAYEEAVQSLLPQHPFLDSKEPKPSGAVFSACILAAALVGGETDLRKAAEQVAGCGPNTPNPFLLEFYRHALGETKNIPAEHVGLLYASLEATAGVGCATRLTVEGEENLEVEMAFFQHESSEKRYEFNSNPEGTLRFWRRVSGVNINTEATDVEIGDGGQFELAAPIAVHARSLTINCTELVIKPDPNGGIDQTVYLEASTALADSRLHPPLVRKGAELQVSWPGSMVYPWTPFSSSKAEDPDPRIAEAQRALRRLCISFRSHSKGRLARFKGKVEHFRMTKGALGVALRACLMSDKVLSLEAEMYFLEPDTLGKILGMSFQDLKFKNYSHKSRTYLQTVLDSLSH